LNDTNIAARIDRLPISGWHRSMLWILAIPLFFDLSDIFTFSYAAPVLVRQWDLSMHQVALATSAGFLGMFLGALFGGALSDRIGRKRSLFVFVPVFSLFSLANGLGNDLPTLLALRFLTGIGISSATVAVVTYIAEMYPARARGRWQSWAMVIAMAAIPVTSWVSLLVVPLGPDGWRGIFVWGALGLPFLVVARRLEESPRWLARHGRLAEAEQVIGRIEARIEGEIGHGLPEPAVIAIATAAPKPRWSALFAAGQAKRTLSLCGIWFFQTVGYYGFMSWAPTLLAEHGIAIVKSLTYLTLMNVGAVPGALIAVFVADRVERKHAIAAVALAIGAFGLLYGLSFVPALIVGFGFLAGTLMQSFATLAFTYTPEQFPTELRNSGTGLAYGVGRLANVANPFIVAAIFSRLGYVPVFVYIAGAWVLTAVIALLFGARTTGRSLEAISADEAPIASAGETQAAAGRGLIA